LAPKDRARVHALLQRMGDFGVIRDPGKFRPEGNGIYAFKSGRIRLLCFLDGRDVLLTNGYDKKAEKVRRQEIDRATRIRASWRAQKEDEAGRE
jgi:mRNA-degrading endonuclease RelE of RelBE toxin-antitoxin system